MHKIQLNIVSCSFALIGMFSSDLLAHKFKVPKSMDNRKTVKVAKNVYVIHGVKAFPNKKNEGFINNPAFVVTSAGVLVIDPGSSGHIGFGVIQRIKKVTRKPVVAVFNTHIHGDHWLGNHAFKVLYPKAKIYAHSYAYDKMKKGEAHRWIELIDRLTEGKSRGTKPGNATHPLKGGETLKFGDTTVKVHHIGRAHTHGDIMIELVEAKTLFTGDIACNQHIASGSPRDSSTDGLIKSTQFVLSTGSKVIVPGHGKTGGPEIVRSNLEFYKTLKGLVKKHFDKGQSDYEMKPKVVKDMSKYKNWTHFDDLGKIINHIYLETEAASF